MGPRGRDRDRLAFLRLRLAAKQRADEAEKGALRLVGHLDRARRLVRLLIVIARFAVRGVAARIALLTTLTGALVGTAAAAAATAALAAVRTV